MFAWPIEHRSESTRIVSNSEFRNAKNEMKKDQETEPSYFCIKVWSGGAVPGCPGSGEAVKCTGSPDRCTGFEDTIFNKIHIYNLIRHSF